MRALAHLPHPYRVGLGTAMRRRARELEAHEPGAAQSIACALGLCAKNDTLAARYAP
jgi:hypothetical protein